MHGTALTLRLFPCCLHIVKLTRTVDFSKNALVWECARILDLEATRTNELRTGLRAGNSQAGVWSLPLREAETRCRAWTHPSPPHRARPPEPQLSLSLEEGNLPRVTGSRKAWSQRPSSNASLTTERRGSRPPGPSARWVLTPRGNHTGREGRAPATLVCL